MNRPPFGLLSDFGHCVFCNFASVLKFNKSRHAEIVACCQ